MMGLKMDNSEEEKETTVKKKEKVEPRSKKPNCGAMNNTNIVVTKNQKLEVSISVRRV